MQVDQFWAVARLAMQRNRVPKAPKSASSGAYSIPRKGDLMASCQTQIVSNEDCGYSSVGASVSPVDSKTSLTSVASSTTPIAPCPNSPAPVKVDGATPDSTSELDVDGLASGDEVPESCSMSIKGLASGTPASGSTIGSSRNSLAAAAGAAATATAAAAAATITPVITTGPTSACAVSPGSSVQFCSQPGDRHGDRHGDRYAIATTAATAALPVLSMSNGIYGNNNNGSGGGGGAELPSSCPVCLFTLQDPRLLPCLHSLCKHCLDQLVTKCLHPGGDDTMTTSAASAAAVADRNCPDADGYIECGSASNNANNSGNESDSLYILCPICRHKCSVSGGRQAQTFPSDIVSRKSVLQSTLGCKQIECSMCDEAVRQPVAAQCSTCSVLLCNIHACSHPLSKGTADHIVQDLRNRGHVWSSGPETFSHHFSLPDHHNGLSYVSPPLSGSAMNGFRPHSDTTIRTERRHRNFGLNGRSDSYPEMMTSSGPNQPMLHFDVCRVSGHEGEPLRIFCRPCDKFICFECFTAEHMLHNCVSAKSMIEYKRRKIQESLEALRQETLPDYESVASNVLDELDLLESKSKSVRQEIQQAIDEGVKRVTQFGKKLTQQVVDIEDTRSKLLFMQHEEVVSHINSMKAAVRFTDMALQHCIGDDLLPVCTLLQDRLDELRLTSLPRKPCESACLVFKTPLATLPMEDFIGVVANSLTAARHCRVEGSGKSRAMPQKATIMTVTTYNREGERVNVGGDKLTAKWITRESCDSDTVISLPITSVEEIPQLCITDEKNGQYTIKYTLCDTGTYMLSVNINNEQLSESPFHIDCSHWCFDADSCTENILLLSNRREAVKVKGSMNNDFLVGNCPLLFGKHKWRVVINTAPYWVAVGVTRKPAYDRKGSWGWSSVAHQLPEGQELDLMCDRWQEKDVLVMELDCENRSLRMTNTRSGRHQTIANLPDGELYPWFVLYKQGDSIRIETDCEVD